ncbi:MAG: peptidoglycan-associated lipoprotein Pal [Proteobacteria bacterium]|nr:peptidoglycan-associated lipoprotein Pal [Pseudomonadota bacterium]HQR03326.1 peptidoglycan-associated lipoprotein Pal [Rhodocyclaceae bacterium]
MKNAALTTSILAAMLIAACSSAPPKAEPPAVAVAQPAPPPPAPAAPAETEAQRIDRVVAQLASKSIYFDYDQFTIKPEFQALLQQDFDALMSVPSASIRLEGNADERGSTEYNLALGQKRAEAVKRALKLLGIPEARMEAISYGKEKPRATCHEERCWAENRRVDFAKGGSK